MMIIGNGKLVTRSTDGPWLEDGAVCVNGNLIQEVNTTNELLRKYPDVDYIDAKGGIIMPGFINTHNHIYSAMARGLSVNGHNPKNFPEILEGLWWNIDRKLTLEQTKYSALTTYIDCIKNGVTTVFDHHASYGATRDSLFTIGDAAKELGVRTCLCYEVSDRNGEEQMKEAVAENEAFINAARKDTTDMQKGMMGLHAAFTLSDKTLAYCGEHKPEEVGYHIHVAEGIDDLHYSLQHYGKRVVNRLMDMNILGPKTITAHCIYINQQEMDLLKTTDTMIVHNPESNMGNAVGCPPTMEQFHKGIVTGLGTDGYTNDMIESMKVANILHKHNTCNPQAAWGEVPAMLFENNRIIANRYFTTPLGTLEPGAAADIIVMDYNPLTPLNINNINSHILFGMNGRNVVTTIINGRVVMKDRELIGIDEERILAGSREQAALLWKSING